MCVCVGGGGGRGWHPPLLVRPKIKCFLFQSKPVYRREGGRTSVHRLFQSVIANIPVMCRCTHPLNLNVPEGIIKSIK